MHFYSRVCLKDLFKDAIALHQKNKFHIHIIIPFKKKKKIPI